MRAFLFYRIITIVILVSVGCSFIPITASAADNDWQFKVEAYGWLTDIEGTLPNDDDIEITLDDILDNLDFTFMVGLMAKKDKWSIVSDVVYLKLSADDGGTKVIDPKPGNPFIIPTKVDIGVEMETWIVNLAGSYSVYQTDKHDVQLLAGVRYFWLDLDAGLDTSIIPADGILVSGQDHVWDGIVGVRGVSKLSDKWILSYRFDIGAGGSDQTWNAVTQLGYQFDWGSLAVGYRYLHYDFDSDFKLMKDLDVHGPLIGALWEF